jgi:hypothetical protein
MVEAIDPISEFREDHRKVRDAVLDISEALDTKDVEKAREILGNLNVIVGPHFRYEEEYLYPELRKFLGDYVDDLMDEHDGAIDTARACADLLSKDSLTDEEAGAARDAAMKLLIHVSNCDGLAILSERFDKEALTRLGTEFAKLREEGVTLLDWAASIRAR